MGHQIDVTGPEIGVSFHSPRSEMGTEKLSQRVDKAVEGGRIFFRLLEFGNEKFPHNTTAQSNLLSCSLLECSPLLCYQAMAHTS